MKKSGRSAITRMDYSKLREMTCMYSIFRDLAIIILSAKFFGLAARKCKAPQVVGEILAGLLIGPCLLNLVQILFPEALFKLSLLGRIRSIDIDDAEPSSFYIAMEHIEWVVLAGACLIFYAMALGEIWSS